MINSVKFSQANRKETSPNVPNDTALDWTTWLEMAILDITHLGHGPLRRCDASNIVFVIFQLYCMIDPSSVVASFLL